jgi:hypothetical protein
MAEQEVPGASEHIELLIEEEEHDANTADSDFEE